MTSKIKVDNINKVSDDSNIIKKCGSTTTVGSGSGNTVVVCGSTVTIGRCGGTVALASGSTQTGFGREGSVNWQTSIKTGDFTAVSGEGYFIDTTSGEITMTLPASPSAGAIVSLKDYANTFDSNKLTIGRNSSKIAGDTSDAEITVEGQALTLVYSDATQGWLAVEAATDSDLPRPAFISASGGTVTTVDTNFKVHTFTGPGSFVVSSGAGALSVVDYVVVAGGGGGRTGPSNGGGGAGGYRESHCSTTSGPYTASPIANPTSLPVSPGPYSITIGAGGAGGAPGSKGSNSCFSTIISAGGGGGGGDAATPSCNTNMAGASGGGGGNGTGPGSGAAGNTPPVSPPQGNPGGCGSNPGVTGNYPAGGGGGATAAGSSGPNTPGFGPSGPGGAGATSSINGTPTARAGGGGGGSYAGEGTPGPGPGGAGGGGAGNGTSGTANTGGGGGSNNEQAPTAAGSGGSGIVIIRYKFQ